MQQCKGSFRLATEPHADPDCPRPMKTDPSLFRATVPCSRLHGMADILTRCPHTGQSIPTGLSTDIIIFETLSRVPIPVHCQACGEVHYWTRSTAWIANKRVN